MSASNSDTTLREAIREAARWFARLNAPDADENTHRQWEIWLDGSDTHRHAWQQIEAVQAGFAGVPQWVATPTLARNGGRRTMLRALSAVALSIPSGWLGHRATTSATSQADLRTAVGERRRLMLDDGTTLTLDTATAVDLGFGPDGRTIHLRTGRIHVETAPLPLGPFARAPLIVETGHGHAQALGTRFTVRTDDASSSVSVIESAVRVSPRQRPEQPTLLRAGEQARFDPHSVGPAMPLESAATSWTEGTLVVVDMPLAHIAEELARYRQGHVGCDPAVAGIQVSGAFPLDDTDRALDLIAHAFPVRVSRFTRYWARLSPAR